MATSAATPKPALRPANPRFSSGPCAKRPGWSPAALEGAFLGRSHRASAPKARLAEVIERSKAILGMPADWRLGIVPASDTGAVEMALWSLLGPGRGIDVLAWESFSEGWATDVTKQLKLTDVRLHKAPYGRLPDLSAVDPARDLVFVWNGTTSGVRLADADWISPAREGLAICDATSPPAAPPPPGGADSCWRRRPGGATARRSSPPAQGRAAPWRAPPQPSAISATRSSAWRTSGSSVSGSIMAARMARCGFMPAAIRLAQ